MSRPSIPALLLAASLPAYAAAAETEDTYLLDEVTVTATRSEARVSQVPVSVSVITAARMEKQLVENIEDLVRYEPGVTVRTAPARFTAAGSSTGRDGHSGFNIRGLEGNRVLIQVDGVRVPDTYSFGAQSVGRGDYVDLGLLRSVEILRGPASALYGSDGVAGAVSFITKDPADLLGADRDALLRVRSSYASVDEALAHSLVGAGRFAGFDAMAAYTRRDGKGQQTGGSNDSSNTDRTTANPEDNQSNAALVKLVREINGQNKVRLSWDHLDRDVDWNVLSAIARPPLAGTSVLHLTAFDRVRRDRFTLDHEYNNEAGPVDRLKTSFSWQSSTTRQYSAEDRNTAADRTRDATFDTLVRSLGIEGRSGIAGDAFEQELVYGVDASRTHQTGVRDGTVPPAGETFPTHAFPTTDYTLVGVFLQDELRWDRLSLYPALRWDHFKLAPQADPLFTAAVPETLTDSRISPKLGALLRLDAGWSVFANAAAGYKAPAPNQVNNGFTNLVSFYTSVSNPELKPETSRTLEVGFRRDTARLSFGVTAFAGRYKDFIDLVLVGGAGTATNFFIYQNVNLTEASIKGVELKSALRLGDAWTWTVAGAVARGHSENEGVNTPLSSIDPLKIVSGLDWNPAGRSYGAQLIATHSGRKEASRLGVACTGGCYVPGAYVIADALGWWSPSEDITMRLGIFNVTDKHYANWEDLRGVSQTSAVKDAYFNAGRNVSASVTVQF